MKSGCDAVLFRTGGEAKASIPVPSDETLHIRQFENGLERPCGRSRPASRHLASLVVADAFAGELTRGSFKTISATEETSSTQRCRHSAPMRQLGRVEEGW